MEIQKKALVVDLSYQVHRNMAVPNLAKLRTKDKVRIGGLFGTLKTLQNEAKYGNYSKIVCCMDSYPAFRKQLFPNYKHSRKSNPDSPEYLSYIAEDPYGWSEKKAKHFTFEKLKEVLPKLCVQTIIQENVEGDDLVYRTCLELTKDGYTCYAMSDDKDYLQLVHLVPGLKVKRVIAQEIITKDNFQEKCGVPAEWFIYYKAMIGDKSDEIPNIAKGFGEVGVKKFIYNLDKYGVNPDNKDLVYDKILEIAQIPDENGKPLAPKVDKEAIEVLKRNMRLMDFRECPYGEAHQEELKTLLNEKLQFDAPYLMETFKKYEMGTLMPMLVESTFKRMSNK